ncbi:MAG: hypothetical protein HY757_08550 [Nitrospirae bacterium]|nr:hypothetical protein [Nitrospirota bacterium]
MKSLLFLMALVCLTLSMNVQNSSAAGGVWTSIGPEGGPISDLAIDPVNTSIIYAGTSYGGVFKNSQLVSPVPDIKANGSDGPLTITSSQSLKLTIALDDGSMAGTNADWWVLCDSPFGWYHYDLSSWVTGIAVTYQGPLFDLGTYQVMDYVLPQGNYTCYFGVDTIMNGAIDMGQIYYGWRNTCCC